MGKYRKAIAIVVWERDQPEEKYVVNLGFHVQAENVDGSWTGIKMTQKELDKRGNNPHSSWDQKSTLSSLQM